MGVSDTPVVVIGAGLAGLACALKLQQAGCDFILLEKSTSVGGRLRTTFTADHFKLDHGFQVLLTSYPEIKNFLDLKSLQLQYFNSGALIYTPDKLRLLANPLLHPGNLLKETISDFISVKDKALVVKLIFSIQLNNINASRDISTLKFLQNYGFSEDFIEIFWRPFCAGVYLDKNLEVDSEYFIFLLNKFSTGRVAVPKNGMQEIPLQMMSKLDKSKVRLNVDIKDYKANEVVLKNAEKITARAVVCAFNGSFQSNCTETESSYRSVTNYYFSTNQTLSWGQWLLLIPPKFGLNINNVAVMSHVSPSYSLEGQHLLSVSVIGQVDPGVDIIINELNQIAGFNLHLKFIDKFIIEKALPKKYSNEETHVENGIYYCGDHLSSPSINGALRSGRLTAEKLLANFEKS